MAETAKDLFGGFHPADLVSLDESPTDCRSSPVPREDGRVVADALVLGEVNYLDGDELGAVGHHI